MFGFFKKKQEQISLKKLDMKLNPNTNFIEYKCPYCNHTIASQYYADPNKLKIDIEFCPNCSKEFIK